MNNDKKKQELFVKYLKNKYGEENLTDEKIKELKDSGLLQKDYQDFEKVLAKKAAHGTKLTYFRTLKNQCAEDEELYYYKKGGSAGCGCKKKEEGGEVVKAGVGVTLAVKAFKAYRKRKAEEEKKKNTWGATSKIVGKDYERGQEDAGPESKVLDNAVRDRKDNPENIIKKKEKKNNSNYYTSMAFEKGDKIVKKFKAKCGSKMKKHKLGGSLNGIPFYLGGTNKGGIKKEYVLPEYMKRSIIGAPTILPGRGYSGLERPATGLFNIFKTWVKGLPKTITLKDYLTGAAGVAGGTALGYDNTHNQYVKKGLQKANEAINDLIEWRPFSAERVIEDLTNPNNKKTPKFKK